jgi:beta-lactamase superfamily II metal-dependent hydrolase
MPFVIESLPAREGDCLWLEYGDAAKPRVVVIDGGRMAAFDALGPKLEALAARAGEVELVMLTHIDADHIEGLIEFVDSNVAVPVREVWFNDYECLVKAKRLSGIEVMGAKQGEVLSEGIVRRKWPWNMAFGGGPVGFDGKKPPAFTLPGGLELTLLSPTYADLAKLLPKWRDECLDANITPGSGRKKGKEVMGATPPKPNVEFAAQEPFKKDASTANRTSITLLATFEGKTALLTGDAHEDVIRASIGRLEGRPVPLPVTLWKLSHHGSKGTTSPALAEAVKAETVLISTDGSRHGHPDDSAIARVLKSAHSCRRLAFNYDNGRMRRWDTKALKNKYGYETRFPDGSGPLRIEL